MKSALLVLFAAASMAAQNSKPTDVNLTQVNDRRSNGHFASLRISLELPKYHYGDVTASRVLVASAVDDMGHDLRDTEHGEPSLDPTGGGMEARDPEMSQRPARVSFELKNPDRKAKTLKEVRGEIELYVPSKDPNSVAEIAKFQSMTGKTLSSKALAANNIEIAMISPAQLEVEKKKIAEVKRKEAKDAGMTGDDLENYVKDSMSSVLAPEKDDIVVRIKDPEKRIHRVVYVDGSGEEKNVSSHDEKGFIFWSTWSGPPQPDWKLRVTMKTAKNIVRNSFVLTNVALP